MEQNYKKIDTSYTEIFGEITKVEHGKMCPEVAEQIRELQWVLRDAEIRLQKAKEQAVLSDRHVERCQTRIKAINNCIASMRGTLS